MNEETIFTQEENGIDIDNPGRIIYVDRDATGNGNGTSWENAYTDLQAALGASQPEDQIWVAEGTYLPTTDGDRDRSFFIKTGIEVYGGFAGGETELAQRDILGNPTILSGNIGNQSDRSDNSYHVVRIDDTSFFTVVDGFTIVEGQANSTSTRGNGGGIYARDNGNASLRNLVIANNVSSFGGGIYLESSNFNVSNVAFFNNNASSRGGGFYSNNSIGEINNSLFVNNRSAEGGAIGTGFVGDNGINIANGTFANNQGDSGGIIFAASIRSNGNGINLENSIVGQNLAGDDNLFVVDDNNITVNNSIVRGGFNGAGNGNLDADPLFVAPENNNYSLQADSPAIDAGNNTAVGEISSDLVGNPRILGDTVDLGAYEFILAAEDMNDNPPTDNPDNPPTDNPEPDNGGDIPEGNIVYRFFNTEVGVHFYTASEAERDNVSQNLPQYTPEGGSYISAPESDSITGVAPVYRFFNTNTGVHLYTISEAERDSIADNLPNYQLEGIAYYGYTEPLEGTIPLYRFYNPVIDAHFYTPSAAERDNILENLPDYQLEGESGIGFYVQPLGVSDNPTPQPPADPITPPVETVDSSAASDLAAALNGLIS